MDPFLLSSPFFVSQEEQIWDKITAKNVCNKKAPSLMQKNVGQLNSEQAQHEHVLTTF